MKFIIKIVILFLAFALVSCEQEIVERFDTLKLPNGGYIRTVTPFPVTNTTFNVKKSDMAGTKWEILAEAVTPNGGANFDRYELIIRFVDATPANGNNSKPDVPFKTFPSTGFAKDAASGYPRATLSATGKEMMDVLKLTDAEISAGDRFEIRGTMFLKDGRSFNLTNTGANITGGAFYSSPFFYRVNIQQ